MVKAGSCVRYLRGNVSYNVLLIVAGSHGNDELCEVQLDTHKHFSNVYWQIRNYKIVYSEVLRYRGLEN